MSTVTQRKQAGKSSSTTAVGSTGSPLDLESPTGTSTGVGGGGGVGVGVGNSAEEKAGVVTSPVSSGGMPSSTVGAGTAPLVATVRRRKCGTSPFDEYWLNRDCCGLFCAFITYCLHAYAAYTVCFVMIPPWMYVPVIGQDDVPEFDVSMWGFFHRTAYTIISALAVLSHFKAMTTDPGAVPPDAKPLPEEQTGCCEEITENKTAERRKGMKLCRRCNAFKPLRAHHCSVCRRCIIKMDHHCPWVNNCVGIGNHKYFLLFVFYTFVSCVYTITLLLAWFFACLHREGKGHNVVCLKQDHHLLNLLGLVIEAALFGMFTSCMMIDQADVINSKMTHIDRLKGAGELGVPSLAGVVEVFGLAPRQTANSTRFRLDWLSPFNKVCFPVNVRDQMMGFCSPTLTRKHYRPYQYHPSSQRSAAEIV